MPGETGEGQFITSTSRKKREVGDMSCHNEVVEPCRAPKVITEARLGGKVQYTVGTRPTQIAINQKRPSAGPGETYGKMARERCLALTHVRACDHDHSQRLELRGSDQHRPCRIDR